MTAIIEDAAGQFRVQAGDCLQIDLREVPEGGSVVFDKVLLLSSPEGRRIGTPYVAGARVRGTVLGAAKGPRTIALHFRKRKGSAVRRGHRQKYLQVRIEAIEG